MPEFIPQELWDCITATYTPFDLKDAASALNLNLTKAEKNHESLWRSIFKDDKWLTGAVETYGVNPILLSADLGKYYTYYEVKGKRSAYIFLIADDKHHRDLQYTYKIFVESLQDYEDFNRETKEISFKCGITLNLYATF
jgi:hypothetical protein